MKASPGQPIRRGLDNLIQTASVDLQKRVRPAAQILNEKRNHETGALYF